MKMCTEYKATTLLELLVVMILLGIVMLSIYRSLDIGRRVTEGLTKSCVYMETITDSICCNCDFFQDSIYFAGREKLRLRDKENEILYDE